MADEEVVAAAVSTSPTPSVHKRKLEDLEPKEAPESIEPTHLEPADSNGNSNTESDAAKNTEATVPDSSEAKRPRLEDKSDGLASIENGYQVEEVNKPTEENAEQPSMEENAEQPSMEENAEQPSMEENAEQPSMEENAEQPSMEENAEQPSMEENAEQPSMEENAEQPSMEENAEQPSIENPQSDDVQDMSKETQEIVNNEQHSTDVLETVDTEQPSTENPQLDDSEKPVVGEVQPPSAEMLEQENAFSEQQQPSSEVETMSRKMEVPNNKVGVLIGKAGDTIRFLQYNSGAKIQITRDAEADPSSTTRPVELIGSLENINKAERLIKDVIAEADAGGSPSLVARGFSTTTHATGPAEQIEIQVPNEKVGLIIGKGGETIKSLQTKSGARIQLIPQHLPEGDQSRERTVRVTGDKKQIEVAKELIKEVMNQTVRSSGPSSGGYNQHGYRPRGPTGPPQWGPRGHHNTQAAGYDYQQRGYGPPSQNQQYPQNYGNYPPQQPLPRGNFGSGWEQRPPVNMQGPPQSGGYDYYGGHEAPASGPHSVHTSGPPPMGPPSQQQPNYNYGQPQGQDYGQSAPYSQSAPAQQGYGHGYKEANHLPAQQGYAHGSSQPVYSQTVAQPGYAQQQQYGNQQGYNAPPRTDMPYQGQIPPNQSYPQNVPTQQQPYMYPTSAPMQQQSYPPYTQPPVDGYNQPTPASGPGYPQPVAQPGPVYTQPGGGQYVQGGPAPAGYGQYPATQTGYAEQQPAPNNAGYGYQGGVADPAYNSGGPGYGAPQGGQPGYVQQTQVSYDQSIPQSGGYASVPVGASAPVGYGKSVSPQPGYAPQYDANQMYGAPR